MLAVTEKTWLQGYAAGGKKLVITGADATGLDNLPPIIRFPDCPGRAYAEALQKDFEHTLPDSQKAFLDSLERTGVEIAASPMVATSVAQVDGKVHIFMANFAGLRGGANPVQTPQTGVRITIPAQARGQGFFLPFLGDVQKLDGGQTGGRVSFDLPPIPKGAVFWYQP